MSNQNLLIYSGIGITSVIGAILSYKYNILSFFDEEEKEALEPEILQSKNSLNKEKEASEPEILQSKNSLNKEEEKETPPDENLVIKKSKRRTIKRKTPRKRRY